jgi:hypothetical protein
MQNEFRAIVQSEYSAPEKVLRIAKRELKSEELGADDVLVKVSEDVLRNALMNQMGDCRLNTEVMPR